MGVRSDLLSRGDTKWPDPATWATSGDSLVVSGRFRQGASPERQRGGRQLKTGRFGEEAVPRLLPDVFLREPTGSGERTRLLECFPRKLKALNGRILVQAPFSQLITLPPWASSSTFHDPEKRTKVLVDAGAGGGELCVTGLHENRLD